MKTTANRKLATGLLLGIMEKKMETTIIGLKGLGI